DDDEHVHQLRVSARRALAAMHFFQELIPDSDCRWFRKMLKAVLRKTREARELDVLIKDYITAKAQLQKLLQTTKKPRDRENLRRLINRMNRRISEQTALYRLWSKSRGRRKVVECLEVIREQVAGDQAGR
ncbi:MAG: CHAD domain-containing protein, partial [Planctomycetaceae bacterium]|nr:CHAD domain-containing protein [Planctomycetaceae bacterium]